MHRWLKKYCTFCLAVGLAFPAARLLAQSTPENAAPENAPPQTATSEPAPSAGSATESPAAPAPGQAEGTSASAQSAPNQNSGTLNQPVGTAVAPYEKTSGVTASRPAGAVIAPAKQRRVRAFFIKIAVVVGAGAAVGAVAILSHSSPSQPR